MSLTYHLLKPRKDGGPGSGPQLGSKRSFHLGQVIFHQSLAGRMRSNAERLKGKDKEEVLANAKKSEKSAKFHQTEADKHKE